MPFSVVPVPVLVNDSSFCVPLVVLLVRFADSKLMLAPIEAGGSLTVYVALNG